jgi:hypothetical protein
MTDGKALLALLVGGAVGFVVGLERQLSRHGDDGRADGPHLCSLWHVGGRLRLPWGSLWRPPRLAVSLHLQCW